MRDVQPGGLEVGARCLGQSLHAHEVDAEPRASQCPRPDRLLGEPLGELRAERSAQVVDTSTAIVPASGECVPEPCGRGAPLELREKPRRARLRAVLLRVDEHVHEVDARLLRVGALVRVEVRAELGFRRLVGGMLGFDYPRHLRRHPRPHPRIVAIEPAREALAIEHLGVDPLGDEPALLVLAGRTVVLVRPGVAQLASHAVVDDDRPIAGRASHGGVEREERRTEDQEVHDGLAQCLLENRVHRGADYTPAMRRIVGIVLGSVLALALILAAGFGVLFAMQPTSFRIARSRTISAPPTTIRALLVDMRSFSTVGLHLGPPDPTRTVTVSPTPTGLGAWIESHDDGGTSRLTLLSESDSLVEFQNENDGAPDGARIAFELRPVPTGTEVTLTLSNRLHGLGRALWPFVGLEGRVAPHMDDSLRHLETVVFAR